MVVIAGSNIISPLGFTTDENYRNIKLSKTGMRRYEGTFGLPEPFTASVIDEHLLSAKFAAVRQTDIDYTPLEKAAILSVSDAVSKAGIDPADKRVLFVLSSTKGNVHLLDKTEAAKYEPERLFIWRSAQLIAEYFGNANTPVTVSTACISGASALLAAARELESGAYDYAVVTGVDMLSGFIISGFQSFKALSDEPCKPFDAARTGLNLGEAAATIVLARQPEAKNCVFLLDGAVRNDANHISGPSRTGEGAYRALRKVMQTIDPQDVAFVSAHGTATPYNDDMESVAITRAGLSNVPVCGLKGYFGHTLGAAGVLESIISAQALLEGIALKTEGCTEPGTVNPLRVTTETLVVPQTCCIKMLSGFGGCNAALAFMKV